MAQLMKMPYGRAREHQLRFERIMEVARSIAAMDATGLYRLIFALMRDEQTERLLSVAEQEPHGAVGELRPDGFFFDDRRLVRPTEHLVTPKVPERVHLGRDAVMPTPWRREDFANALANIGAGRSMGEWEEDGNHTIWLWLPWRIAFVTGGNHSIAAGILGSEGCVTATDVYDMRVLLDRVECDGRHYVERATGRRLERVSSYRRAAVFEIGRLLPAPADGAYSKRDV